MAPLHCDGRFGQTAWSLFHKEVELIHRQRGFINFGSMTLLIGGLALAGLLLYGWRTGQDLPVLPAVAVALVNIVGAGRLIYETKRKKDLLARAQAEAEAVAKKKPAKADRVRR